MLFGNITQIFLKLALETPKVAFSLHTSTRVHACSEKAPSLRN